MAQSQEIHCAARCCTFNIQYSNERRYTVTVPYATHSPSPRPLPRLRMRPALGGPGRVAEHRAGLDEALVVAAFHALVIGPVAEVAAPNESEMERAVQRMMDTFADQREVLQRMLDRLPVTEPFNRNPDAAKRIVEKYRS